MSNVYKYMLCFIIQNLYCSTLCGLEYSVDLPKRHFCRSQIQRINLKCVSPPLRLRGACEDIKIPCVDDLTRELNMLLADGRSGKNESEPIPELWCDEDWPLDPETGKRTFGPWMYESEEFEELPGMHEAHLVVRAPLCRRPSAAAS